MNFIHVFYRVMTQRKLKQAASHDFADSFTGNEDSWTKNIQ
ncbi:hypothetical protein ACFOLK_04605 [Marinococcus halophilus]|nr:hypothetical protein [Marinococcus halophilus]